MNTQQPILMKDEAEYRLRQLHRLLVWYRINTGQHPEAFFRLSESEMQSLDIVIDAVEDQKK
jgi:hypothetical protein